MGLWSQVRAGVMVAAGLAGLAACATDPAWQLDPAWESTSIFERLGSWDIRITEPGACVGERPVAEHVVAQFHEVEGVVAAFRSDRELPQAGEGLIEADGVRLTFDVDHLGNGHIAFRPALTSAQLDLLRRAREMRIVVDGRDFGNVDLVATRFPDMLDELHKCALGALGWWGQAGAVPKR